MLMSPNPATSVMTLARFVYRHMLGEPETTLVAAHAAKLRIVREEVDLDVVMQHDDAATLEEITCFDTEDGPFEFADAFARALEAFMAEAAGAAQAEAARAEIEADAAKAEIEIDAAQAAQVTDAEKAAQAEAEAAGAGAARAFLARHTETARLAAECQAHADHVHALLRLQCSDLDEMGLSWLMHTAAASEAAFARIRARPVDAVVPEEDWSPITSTPYKGTETKKTVLIALGALGIPRYGHMLLDSDELNGVVGIVANQPRFLAMPDAATGCIGPVVVPTDGCVWDNNAVATDIERTLQNAKSALELCRGNAVRVLHANQGLIDSKFDECAPVFHALLKIAEGLLETNAPRDAVALTGLAISYRFQPIGYAPIARKHFSGCVMVSDAALIFEVMSEGYYTPEAIAAALTQYLCAQERYAALLPLAEYDGKPADVEQLLEVAERLAAKRMTTAAKVTRKRTFTEANEATESLAIDAEAIIGASVRKSLAFEQ